jgi:ribose transport system ATP-binding protein
MSEGRITGELSADEATQEQVMHLATLRPASEPVLATTEQGEAGER